MARCGVMGLRAGEPIPFLYKFDSGVWSCSLEQTLAAAEKLLSVEIMGVAVSVLVFSELVFSCTVALHITYFRIVEIIFHPLANCDLPFVNAK